GSGDAPELIAIAHRHALPGEPLLVGELRQHQDLADAATSGGDELAHRIASVDDLTTAHRDGLRSRASRHTGSSRGPSAVSVTSYPRSRMRARRASAVAKSRASRAA